MFTFYGTQINSTLIPLGS